MLGDDLQSSKRQVWTNRDLQMVTHANTTIEQTDSQIYSRQAADVMVNPTLPKEKNRWAHHHYYLAAGPRSFRDMLRWEVRLVTGSGLFVLQLCRLWYINILNPDTSRQCMHAAGTMSHSRSTQIAPQAWCNTIIIQRFQGLLGGCASQLACDYAVASFERWVTALVCCRVFVCLILCRCKLDKEVSLFKSARFTLL